MKRVLVNPRFTKMKKRILKERTEINIILLIGSISIESEAEAPENQVTVSIEREVIIINIGIEILIIREGAPLVSIKEGMMISIIKMMNACIVGDIHLVTVAQARRHLDHLGLHLKIRKIRTKQSSLTNQKLSKIDSNTDIETFIGRSILTSKGKEQQKKLKKPLNYSGTDFNGSQDLNLYLILLQMQLKHPKKSQGKIKSKMKKE